MVERHQPFAAEHHQRSRRLANVGAIRPQADPEPGRWPVLPLGEAARPTLQYLAQSACLAKEDTDVLARLVEESCLFSFSDRVIQENPGYGGERQEQLTI